MSQRTSLQHTYISGGFRGGGGVRWVRQLPFLKTFIHIFQQEKSKNGSILPLMDFKMYYLIWIVSIPHRIAPTQVIKQWKKYLEEEKTGIGPTVFFTKFREKNIYVYMLRNKQVNDQNEDVMNTMEERIYIRKNERSNGTTKTVEERKDRMKSERNYMLHERRNSKPNPRANPDVSCKSTNPTREPVNSSNDQPVSP